MQNKEIQVDIYISVSVLDFFKNRILQNNIKLIPVNDKNFVLKTLDLSKKLLFKKYDLIFMPTPMPIFITRSKRVKLIHDLTIKQTPQYFSKSFHLYIDFLIKCMYKFDNSIGYISNATKKDIKTFYSIDENNKKLLYLPNGIPSKVQNRQRPTNEHFYNKYKKDEIEFIVVGRINNSKGFDRIIKFLEYFDKQNKFSKMSVNIVGKQTTETKKIFLDIDLKNIDLIFHGFVDDAKLNKLFDNSHFCFFLSRNEGYGLPLVEAMWLKVIPIVSDIAIFNEIMTEDYPKFSDKNGYTKAIANFIANVYYDDNYLKEIYNKLEHVVINEKDGYKKASENLVKYIKETN